MENWARRPPGWLFNEIGGVGVDRNDNVFVFNRGEHPMIVFDREGNFLRSFGEGLFPRAHGVFMAPDDTVWLTDDGDHTVRQCTLESGRNGAADPRTLRQAGSLHEREPFHRCTHTDGWLLSRGTATPPHRAAVASFRVRAGTFRADTPLAARDDHGITLA